MAENAKATVADNAAAILLNVARARGAIAVWIAACTGIDGIDSDNVLPRQVGAAAICSTIHKAEKAADETSTLALELLYARCTFGLIDAALWNYAVEDAPPPDLVSLIETARLADDLLAEFMSTHGAMLSRETTAEVSHG